MTDVKHQLHVFCKQREPLLIRKQEYLCGAIYEMEQSLFFFPRPHNLIEIQPYAGNMSRE
jgi:hypothetical protein